MKEHLGEANEGRWHKINTPMTWVGVIVAMWPLLAMACVMVGVWVGLKVAGF